MRFSITIGVAIGVIGALLYGGALVTSYAKDRDSSVAALQVQQVALKSEYQRLQSEIGMLSASLNTSKADQRVTATQINHIQLDINRIAAQMERLTALYYGERAPVERVEY